MDSKKYKILIVDDSEMNRDLLTEMLEDEYEIVEAENGIKAISILQEQAQEFSLVLLDILMPEMDGFEVLAYMNRYHWIDDLPVIMISAENSSSYIARAYDFGATDYITRPFDIAVVNRRVINTIMFYAKQKRLIDMVADQIYEKEKSNSLMINILSHIVEFRNGESGLHVLHISVLTELLLNRLVQKTERYNLTRDDISLIKTASALHDIGKISIPSEILNKPGKLTDEEFKVMKQHSAIGAEMLGELEYYQDEPLVKVAYEICRWHHERYDGRGYPDGLVGEEIPISAQVVAVADVYDALTSERCYKKAFSHETALAMILDGQCGTFNPLVLECLKDLGDEIQKELNVASPSQIDQREMEGVTEQMLKNEDLGTTSRMLKLLELERLKFQFVESLSTQIIITYTDTPPMISMSEASAQRMGLAETVVDPKQNEQIREIFGDQNMERIRKKIREATREHPTVIIDCQLKIHNKTRWYRCTQKVIWTSANDSDFGGIISKISDIQDEYEYMESTRNREIQYALEAFQDTDDFSKQLTYKLNKKSLVNLMKYLEVVFDAVRCVDASIRSQYVLSQGGKLVKEPYSSHEIEGQAEQYENSVSAKVLHRKDKRTKFEFAGDKIFHVIGIYIEVDGEPYCLELITKINDETLLGGYGKDELVDKIVNHNKQMFIDSLTGVYNRRYYEEQFSHLFRADAAVMMDVDNFKNINDTYGHQAGDQALRLIAGAVRTCVRSTDALFRYGGDEFAIIFKDIPKEIFAQKVDQILKRINDVTLMDYPMLRFSASIGGIYGPGKVSDLILKADQLMYQAKIKKNAIQVEVDDSSL